jgi:hypothetical protein
MSVVRIRVTSPLVVLTEAGAQLTGAGEWTFGASSTGRRALFEVTVEGLEVRVAEDTGVVVLEGEAWEALTVDVAVRKLETDQGELQIAGLELGLARLSDASKVRWVRSVFVGAPAGIALLQELQRRAPEPWTPESFTLALISALTARHPSDAFDYVGPLQIRYSSGEQTGSMDLGNAWEAGNGDHARLEELLDVRVRMYADLIAPVRAERERVVAQVKHRAAVEQVVELYGADGPVTEPLAGDAVLLYALDLPNGIMPLRESQRLSLGLAREALRGLAAENLLALHDVVRVSGYPGHTHLMVTCGGNYEASMLLVPELWAEIDPVLQGDRVVAIPNRDLLLIGDGANPALVEQVAGFAKEMNEKGAYPVVPHLLTWREDRWQAL